MLWNIGVSTASVLTGMLGNGNGMDNEEDRQSTAVESTPNKNQKQNRTRMCDTHTNAMVDERLSK